VGLKGPVQHCLASNVDLFGSPFVNTGRRHHADPAVPVLVVGFVTKTPANNHDFEVDRARNWIEPLAQGAGF
jgi:hypothetical protein